MQAISLSTLYPVCLDGKYGYIDNTGKIAIKPQFEGASDFSEGLAWVLVWDKNYIDEKGTHWPGKIQGHGLIDKTGAYIIEPPPSRWLDETHDFSEGIARVRIWRGGHRPYAYFDRTGRLAMEQQFFLARDFSEGLAYVAIGTGTPGLKGWDYEFGFIDKTGKLIIKPRKTHFGSFHDGLARLGITRGFGPIKISRWGYINQSGKVVLKLKCNWVMNFSNGMAPVLTGAKFDTKKYTGLLGGKWGYIDKTGKYTVEPQFDLAGSFSEGLAAVNIGGEVFQREFRGGKWGYIDKTGELVIKPEFDEAHKFSEGVAAVKANNKWGFIDTTCNITIKPQFDGVKPFSNGLARINIYGTPASHCSGTVPDDWFWHRHSVSGGKWGYIDKTGQYVWTPREYFLGTAYQGKSYS